ncbi:hypothetical protein HPP92_020199, partial [Vanilla planifolia]
LHKERDVGAAETNDSVGSGATSWTNLLADEAQKTEADSLVSARARRALDPILRAARMRDCS